MPDPDESVAPEDVQELSLNERNPNLDSAKSDAEWQAEQGTASIRKPTSSHEDKGWRALKPF